MHSANCRRQLSPAPPGATATLQAGCEVGSHLLLSWRPTLVGRRPASAGAHVISLFLLGRMDHGLMLHCCCVSGFAGARCCRIVRTAGGHGIQRHRPQRYYRVFSDSDKQLSILSHSHFGILMPGASIRILVPLPATDLTCWEAVFPCIW